MLVILFLIFVYFSRESYIRYIICDSLTILWQPNCRNQNESLNLNPYPQPELET